jgi:biotin operon repressor
MLKKIGVQVLYLHPYYSIVQSPVVPPSPFTAILSNTL